MTDVRWINLTPHPIVVELPSGRRAFPPSGVVARAQDEVVGEEHLDGIPIAICADGPLSALPEPEDGVVLLVSDRVARSARRSDVVAPDTGTASVIRDATGTIVAVRRLKRVVV